MVLNWSFEVILTFIALITLFISFLISLRQHLKTRYQHSLFLCLIWISYIGWGVCQGISKLYLSKPLYWFTGLFLTAVLVSIILFGESLENDIKISKKLLLVLFLQSLIVLGFYDEDLVVEEIYLNNERGLRLNQPFVQALMFVEILLSTIFVVIIMVKVLRNVPAATKAKTAVALLGIISFSSIGILYIMLGGATLLPGLNMLFTFLGSLLFGFSFMKEPKMMHILSFKMLRLQVIDTASGLGMYSHTWKAGLEIGDEDLFSGMMQGVSLIVQESVRRGAVEEIKLSKGILIINRIPNSSISCVLVATKSTAPLRQALMNFAQKFNDRFRDKFQRTNEISQFDQASEIVAESFPFLWES